MYQISNIALNLKLMQNGAMRTTITLDDDVHEFASYYASARGLTLSAAMNELVRKAQARPQESKPIFRHSPNGLPLLPRTGRVITCEMVKALSEDEVESEIPA
jgi:hypothetical protein